MSAVDIPSPEEEEDYHSNETACYATYNGTERNRVDVDEPLLSPSLSEEEVEFDLEAEV